MAMRANPPAERALTGWHVLAITLAFFAVVIGVNVTLAVLARSSWSGLVVESSYVASQNFNSDLAAARRQQGFGWKEEVRLRRGGIEVKVTDAEGRALTDLTVEVLLQRPATGREDRKFALTAMGGGLYNTDAAIGTGIWIADVTAQAPDGRAFRMVRRLTVAEN